MQFSYPLVCRVDRGFTPPYEVNERDLWSTISGHIAEATEYLVRLLLQTTPLILLTIFRNRQQKYDKISIRENQTSFCGVFSHLRRRFRSGAN